MDTSSLLRKQCPIELSAVMEMVRMCALSGAATRNRWLLSSSSVAREAEELNSFHLTSVHLNLDSYAWLVSTALDLAALELGNYGGQRVHERHPKEAKRHL